MPPNGVSIRLPPAKGLAGWRVWQLAQSPASTSDLPRAIVSADGSAASAGAASAPHKIRATRIAVTLCGGRCIHSPLQRIIAALRHFAPSPLRDTKRNGLPRFSARNCDLPDRGFIAEICGAKAAKTDIDWR